MPAARRPARPSPRLTRAERELCDLALAARQRAYAPYSGFAVGAALRSEDGSVFSGCNVENASFGLTICAERNAIAAAVAAGQLRFSAVAIATATTEPAAPCGACRQVLAEFAPDLPLLLVSARGTVRRARLSRLLPHGFFGTQLPRRR